MVIQLIDKLDYDVGVKKRFSAKIGELFDRHESFLSTPLLAILMLMTFQKNASIPDKMYLFYGRAFETLFNQHDAVKEQYERPRKTKLHIDEFSGIFSTFCFATYVKEKFEFTKTEVVAHLREAVRYHGSEVDVECLLYDLQESVCLLVSEGGDYFFVHRSFQEYFTALFLSTCPEQDRDRFLDSRAARHWDEVLPMLFDMASEQLVATYLKDRMADLLRKIGPKEGQTAPVYALYGKVYFSTGDDGVSVWHISWGDFGKNLAMLRALLSVGSQERKIDLSTIADYLKANLSTIVAVCENLHLRDDNSSSTDYSIELSHIPEIVLSESGMLGSAALEFDGLRKVWRKFERERISRDSFIAEVLSGESRR